MFFDTHDKTLAGLNFALFLTSAFLKWVTIDWVLSRSVAFLAFRPCCIL